jgi:hypothetical protein
MWKSSFCRYFGTVLIPRQTRGFFLRSFLLLSTSYEWAQSCPQTAGLYLSAKCKMAEHSSYPKLLLRERKQELEHLDETRPNYESCRRSLEQAIQELTTLLGDRIEDEDI